MCVSYVLISVNRLLTRCICISFCFYFNRGRDFRPAFARIGGLRATVPFAPVIALTATATMEIRKNICEKLCMFNPTTIHIVSNRPNIKYKVVKLEGDWQSNLIKFEPIIKLLNDTSNVCPKILIYCSTIDVVSSVYSYFHSRIPNPGTPLSPVAMFHKSTSQPNKSHVLSEFPKPDSVVRVVVCSVAFGLGVNIPDIRQVFNFGIPRSVEEFVQMSGRAGRDGEVAISTIYHIPSLRRRETDAAMLKYCSRDIPCRRKFLAQHFRLTDYVEYAAPEIKSTPQCCDLCNPV